MIDADAGDGGARERKRRQTRQRITEAGLKLFGAQGYEATTLEAIAAEAGISRRTFFHYFKSKDDILLSLQTGLGNGMVAALERQSADDRPHAAARRALDGVIAPFTPEELLTIDRLMRSSEAVQARKQASYARDEAMLFAALVTLWPEESEIALRLVAAIVVGAARLSIERWSAEGGTRKPADVLRETFDALEGLHL